MPRGRYVRARVQIFPFAYSFRAGSQIRVTVQAPGGDRPLWKFDVADRGPGADRADRPRSRITRRASSCRCSTRTRSLPVTPAPCPSLRAEPCRTYVAPAAAGS